MFSIIVPIYNAESSVGRCIESALNQSFSDFELLLVDDGSTDGSAAVCERWADKDSRIKLLKQQNLGATSARNAGLNAATRDYIVFADSDDRLQPEFLAEAKRIIERFAPDMVILDFSIIYEDVIKPVSCGYREGLYNREKLKQEVYPSMLWDSKGEFYSFGIYPSLWAKVFKKSLIYPYQTAVDEYIGIGEDAACVYMCITAAQRVYISHFSAYDYVINQKSMTKSFQKDRFPKIDALIRYLNRTLLQILPAIEKQLKVYTAYMFMNGAVNEAKGGGNFWQKRATIAHYLSQPHIFSAVKAVKLKKARLRDRLFFCLAKLKMLTVLTLILTLNANK